MPPGARGDLDRGRSCFAQRAWDDAFEALSSADEREPLERDDLELLALAAGLTARDEAMLLALERAYQACLDAAEHERAARQAFWLSFRLFALSEPGRASGWLGRAHRLIDHGDACVEHGYLLLPELVRHVIAGNYPAAIDAAVRAAQIGERFGDVDLVALARTFQARASMRHGDVSGGLALLDEAMLTATSQELSPLVTGLVYCSAIASCQQHFAVERSREWTAALATWCASQPQLVTFGGHCLVHRAEIMQLGGDWPQALEQAERACAWTGASDPETLADAHYQRAELHRLRGELEAAQDAYRCASEQGREPQPGLALLRLSQGRREEAANAIRRVLETTPVGWQRARSLPAAVEVLLAAGDLDAAQAACRELEIIAEGDAREVLTALAGHGRGAVRLAQGDAAAAVEPLRRAFRTWKRIGAPFLGARSRTLVGRACLDLGDREGAELELSAARRVFEQLGAAPALAELDLICAPATLATVARPADTCGLSPREVEVLRLLATGKTNRAIAGELYVSERTIDRHVSNILAKLGVPSRAAATAFAYEHDLV